MKIIIAISVFEVHIPRSRSLKEKRRVIKTLMDRIHQRYRVSIAETDFHDLHQRAEFALAAVHRSPAEVERLLESIRELVEQLPDALLVSWQPEILEGL